MWSIEHRLLSFLRPLGVSSSLNLWRGNWRGARERGRRVFCSWTAIFPGCFWKTRSNSCEIFLIFLALCHLYQRRWVVPEFDVSKDMRGSRQRTQIICYLRSWWVCVQSPSPAIPDESCSAFCLFIACFLESKALKMASSLNPGCSVTSVALFLLGLPNYRSNFLIF